MGTKQRMIMWGPGGGGTDTHVQFFERGDKNANKLFDQLVELGMPSVTALNVVLHSSDASYVDEKVEE